jgi:ubiquinone/menaquinone biosynthesis C-methylase UbiE
MPQKLSDGCACGAIRYEPMLTQSSYELSLSGLNRSKSPGEKGSKMTDVKVELRGIGSTDDDTTIKQGRTANSSRGTALEQSDYIFADREDEQQRLERQAEIIEPLTERAFLAAGLAPGMRVLDVGTGAGDVALLAARLVGSDGEVVSVERDPAAVAAATARLDKMGLSNVRIVQGDAQTLDGVESGFDAVVGRVVLMYLPDPVAALARVSQLLRPGGLVCFQECDMTYGWAAPMTPLWRQARAWSLETLKQARVTPSMGLSLYSCFVTAGLPAPELRLESAVAGGPEAFAWGWANVVRGLLPLMERLGVATAADVEPDTLAERLLHDVVAFDGIVIGPPLVAAWARMPT